MSVEEVFRRDRVENSDIREWKRRRGSRKASALIKMWQKRIEEIEGKT
jgi:hypothetical protein